MTRSVPSWGLVTAAPHEHLVLVRGGRVVRSQQGGSVFRRPGDTVARVDTSVHRLQFTADQVTREKTGVKVTGLAVFRIVSPVLAFRMLNLEDPLGHVEILREMFVGATRRLVANLTLEQCLTRRKESLATELMDEVAPVVEGNGRTEDGTDRGWGVAIDTIEVQDVRVLSEEVFSRLQAPFREKLALEALRARDEVEREQAVLAEAHARREEERRRERMALEEARLEAERERERVAAAHREELARRELEAELALEEARVQARVRHAELAGQARRLEGAAEAEVERLQRAARDHVSEAWLQEILLTRTLPEMARAFRDSYDQITVTGGDASFLGQGLAQVMATLRAFGVSWPREG